MVCDCILCHVIFKALFWKFLCNLICMMWLKFPTKIFSGLVQETADVLQSVEIVTSSGDWCTLSKEREELAYSYRTSPFQKMKHVAAIVAATFQLTPCPNARQRQKLFLDRYLPSTFCYACYRLRNCNSAPDIPCCTTHSRLV